LPSLDGNVYGGNAGTGTCSTITGARVFYAGGGGGASYVPSGVPSGLGVAGGANGADSAKDATSAIANSGGGGGGGNGNFSGGFSFRSSAGGSGIVIIRYPANFDPPASVVGTLQGVQGSIANGYRVYIWTSSGTITF
jgi:hypothetical protein